MDVQAIKKPGKKLKLYGKELSIQQMGVQASRSIPTKVFRVEFYGYLKWKSAMMIFERHANLKYKFWNRHFWETGYYALLGLVQATRFTRGPDCLSEIVGSALTAHRAMPYHEGIKICVRRGRPMAYCRKCGAQISDYASVCPECGAPQDSGQNTPQVVDNGGFLWGLLGCCIPIVGLVLFLVWKDTKPRTAKAAGIGALVCVIAYVLLYVLAAVAGIGAALVY